jgi:hypothetical protein
LTGTVASSPSTPVARACTTFALTQCHGYSPLYETIALAVAEDDELLALLSTASPNEARLTLLLAAVHYLLLGGIDHPLAQFYDSVRGRGPDTPDPVSVAHQFRSFCHDFRPSLVELVGSRHTQTNDVRRSAALVLALQRLALSNDLPVHLIELGSSAGLNLLYERYRYRFGVLEVGDPVSGVEVPVSIDDRITVEERLPPSASTTGIDLAPVDIADDGEVRWLRSFVWPELTDDADRLMAAVDIARRWPPLVLEGEANDLLPSLLEDSPDDSLPVVLHSTLLTYLGRDERTELFATLDRFGHEHPLAWIALESPGLLAQSGGIDLGLPEAANSRFVLTLATWPGRERRASALALVDPYGRWMQAL